MILYKYNHIMSYHKYDKNSLTLFSVWDILAKTPEGMQIADSFLPQQPTLSDMTQTDLNFALRVEQMFSRIAHPEYRQLMVEVRVGGLINFYQYSLLHHGSGNLWTVYETVACMQ